MRLRDLPKNSIVNKTVHPFPWLFGRETQGDETAIALLDTEVGDRFAYDGGLLVYIRASGSWDVAAEIHRGKVWIRDRDLATRATEADWIGANEDIMALLDNFLQQPTGPAADSIF